MVNTPTLLMSQMHIHVLNICVGPPCSVMDSDNMVVEICYMWVDLLGVVWSVQEWQWMLV